MLFELFTVKENGFEKVLIKFQTCTLLVWTHIEYTHNVNKLGNLNNIET